MEDHTRRIDQLIPLAKLQSTLQRFSTSVALGCIIIDPKGEVILEEDWPCFCNNPATRQIPACQGCTELKHLFAGRLPTDTKSCVFTCKSGFHGVGAPIIIEGLHVASIFAGLFSLSPPEQEIQPTTVAAKRFAEPAEHTTAAHLPVFSTQRLQQTISQLELTAELLTSMAYTVLVEQHANQQVRRSEERFQTLFESASDAILIMDDIDRRVTIVDCNTKALEMFGCTRQEMLGRSPRDFSPSLQANGQTYEEQETLSIAKALQGEPQHFEWLHSRFDGTVFHADVSMNATELSGGQSILAIVRDVSQRKMTETALRKSEFRFRSFFNTNPDGILLIDCQGILLDLNQAFLQESGYSPEDCIHRHFKEFIPTDDQVRVEGAILAIKSGLSHSEPLHFSYIAKDGTIVPVAAKGWLVVDEKSRPLYMGVFIRNLTKELALATEKASLEKQVIQAQKSEAIGTLAGGIAHDFNNILGGIIGYTELALYRNPSAVDDKVREYLEHVLEGGNRAKDLVQQILRFSRHSNVAMAPINLAPVIRESIQLLRSTLPATVTIRLQLDVGCDRVLGDPTQMHQIVMNLATNACHAMRETGGLLTISLENITLTRRRQFMSMTIPPGQYLRLRVTDTGSGIKPAVLERIFEPYFTTKNVNEGSGLGMAVVRGIVKNHQGLIEIETNLGKGTCVDVFLPLTRRSAAENTAANQPLPLGRGERVLIVDDEAFFLEVIEECLKLLGYQVTATQSSPTALQTFQENPHGYDLLITDQTMPEMTGVQLTQEIRRINNTIPIILCTGYSETVTEQSAGYYGITGFLMKPVNVSDLAKTINEIFSQKKQDEAQEAVTHMPNVSRREKD
ncbi:PAS domain S-box protein [uncultured Desulfobulbus sp.]|uniref:PAS domain S-box protein n=1 Tax=uncultured Desulfobulbus sp. TaxID=239745 RepID=UPI0029C5FCD4|nr:PAS domain S-box protein [uncultured Desulfobulbus sp.]